MKAPSIRDRLRQGRGRPLASLIAMVVSGCLYFYISNTNKNIADKTPLALTPFFMLLGVISYNLRNRIIDFSIKMLENAQASNIKISIPDVKIIVAKLTNLVLLGLASAIFSTLSFYLPILDTYFDHLRMIVIGALFGYCIVQYAYACLAFEAVENIILDASYRKGQHNRSELS